jgi:acetylornithine deacetylase/succinyl-diaminopimelate desuccinylase-like protein
VTVVERARSHWNGSGAEILSSFADFISIPNVAADPEGLEATARWIVDRYAERGVELTTYAIDGAPPVVHGRVAGDPDGPTIGIYAHYDGQPVDPAQWSSPPFTATLRTTKLEDGGAVIPLPEPGDTVDPEWRMYARGTSDDRAPIVALLAALDSVEERTANLVLLFEGEEEEGSPHLPRYLADLRDELAADVWLICDGPVHQSGRAQVALGVRGFAELEIEIFGPPHDLHSGHYGDTAVNPIVALSELVVSMRDSDALLRVDAMAGPEPSDAARGAADAVPDPDNLGFAMNPSGSYAGRLLHPLLNLRGIHSADVGEGSRNVIPARAIASIDLRLVAGQDPVACIEAVRDHVTSQGFHLVDGEPTPGERLEHRLLARVDGTPGYPGVRTDPDHPLVRRVINAVARAADEDPVLLPSFGGSVPFHHFVEELGAPLVIVPIANHDNNQHSADENIRVGNLAYGLRVMASLLGTV